MSREMNEGLPGDLRELESRLAGLRPAEPRIDRDALMFGAGRASAARGQKAALRLWQSAFATSVIVFAGLALLQHGGGGRSPIATPGARGPANEAQEAARRSPAADGGADMLARVAGMPEEKAGGYLVRRRQLLDAWAAEPAPAQSGGGTGSPVFMPTLKRAEGLDALPSWQRRAVLPHFGGNQS